MSSLYQIYGFALMMLASVAFAQDSDSVVALTDSSVLPAEVMPLARESLLLDLIRTGQRLVAVGERGHVLLSDNGSDWRQAASVPTRSTLTSVFAVGDKLWAVGYDVIIIHSKDGGENWEIQQVDIELKQPLLDIFFLDESNGFAMGAYGYFLRTRDGGTSWEEGLVMVEAESDEEQSEADDESEPDTVNYDFSDYEDDFTDFHMNGMARLNDGTLFIAAEAGNGLRSTDDGETWANTQFPYEGSMFGVMLAPDDRLIAHGLRGHVLESVDGGLTWDEQTTGTLNSLLGGSVLEDGTVVLVGANGEVLVRDPAGEYQSSRTDEGEDLAESMPDGSGDLLLVGENGVTRHALGANR